MRCFCWLSSLKPWRCEQSEPFCVKNGKRQAIHCQVTDAVNKTRVFREYDTFETCETSEGLSSSFWVFEVNFASCSLIDD